VHGVGGAPPPGGGWVYILYVHGIIFNNGGL
jgi:hypothetical protein